MRVLPFAWGRSLDPTPPPIPALEPKAAASERVYSAAHACMCVCECAGVMWLCVSVTIHPRRRNLLCFVGPVATPGGTVERPGHSGSASSGSLNGEAKTTVRAWM